MSRSLLLGFYFEDDTPLLIWNRNTDLPNKFGMTDPIVWWKHNERKKEMKQTRFFKFGSKHSSQDNDDEVQMDEKDFQKFEKKLLKEQKEGKYSQLYTLDYDLLLKKEDPKVPMYNDYFQEMELQVMLLRRKSHLLFRHAGPLLDYVSEDESGELQHRISGEGSTKLILSCPCIQLINSMRN